MGILKELNQTNLIADGAMGTELQKRGCQLTPLDLANVINPKLVREIHQAYVEAGADIITTNTFRAVTLADYTTVVVAGITVAQSVTGKYVALSMGPTGLVDSRGTIPNHLLKRYGEIGKLGQKHQVDLFLLETFYDLTELEAVSKVLSPLGIPLFASLSLDLGTAFGGDSLERVVAQLLKLKVDGIGLNCLTMSAELVDLVKKIRQLTSLPLIIQGNAGLPQHHHQGWQFPVLDHAYVACLSSLSQESQMIIGGCCGTSPRTISLITERTR